MSFDLVRAIQEVTARETVYDRGNLDLIHYLKDLLSVIDFELVEQTTSVGDRVYANILGMRGPSELPGGLILSAPLDTMPPSDPALWTDCAHNPFAATVVDGSVVGLGVTGGKADFLCKLKAASLVTTEELTRPLYLIGTFGRYLRFLGVRTLLESQSLNARRVLVGAPTNLELVTGSKSYVVFRVTMRAKAPASIGRRALLAVQVEGATFSSEFPFLGDNAIDLALELFDRLHARNGDLMLAGITGGGRIDETAANCELLLAAKKSDLARLPPGELLDADAGLTDLTPCLVACQAFVDHYRAELAKLEPLSDDWFAAPSAVSNLGRIACEGESLSLEFDSRFLPEQDVTRFIRELEAFLGDLEQHHSAVDCKLRIEVAVPPVWHPTGSEFAAVARSVMQRVGLLPVESMMSGATEAALYESHGYDAMIFGPGWPTWSHRYANESISLDQLDKAVKFYEQMIRRCCCE